MAVISIQGVPVAASVEVANTFSARFKGLMLRKSLPAGGGMLLTQCSGAHMFFMQMSLDVVYLSQSYTVLAVDHRLKPWHVGRMVKGCRHVLELPAGQAELEGILPGARLSVRVPMGAGKRRVNRSPATGAQKTAPSTPGPIAENSTRRRVSPAAGS